MIGKLTGCIRVKVQTLPVLGKYMMQYWVLLMRYQVCFPITQKLSVIPIKVLPTPQGLHLLQHYE